MPIIAMRIGNVRLFLITSTCAYTARARVLIQIITYLLMKSAV